MTASLNDKEGDGVAKPAVAAAHPPPSKPVRFRPLPPVAAKIFQSTF